MTQSERISADWMLRLLRITLPSRADDLDQLFDELKPECELDRTEDRILFQARLGSPNIIRVGTKCSTRLEAHAYAAAIVFSAIGAAGFTKMEKAERHALLAPADKLLNWAVGNEVARWLAAKGIVIPVEDVFSGASAELPSELLQSLTEVQRRFGAALFRYASAFIFLHELAHLKLRHDESRVEYEKEADRFSAEMISEAAFDTLENVNAERGIALLGIAVALLWLTVFNVFIGQRSEPTHPQAYDRLYQVIENVIDLSNELERESIWDFISTMLFVHMIAAGFVFTEADGVHLQSNSKDEVNYLIDRISKRDRAR
jgi:hypothetical protein